MSVKVLTEEEADALLKRITVLEDNVRKLLADAGSERSFLTPREVARRFAVREAIVYEACRSGRIVAEVRPGNGQERTYRITPADADRWYDRFIRRHDNQGGAA